VEIIIIDFIIKDILYEKDFRMDIFVDAAYIGGSEYVRMF
jgi:hypothetical protein